MSPERQRRRWAKEPTAKGSRIDLRIGRTCGVTVRLQADLGPTNAAFFVTFAAKECLAVAVIRLYSPPMPTKKQVLPERSIEEVVAELGLYPIEAFEFIQQGLAFTAQQAAADVAAGKRSRHVTGQELCMGLRDFAIAQWGLLARSVLRRWNIACTLDFGRIVFAMVDAGLMSKTDDDSIEDFRNVYDFRAAFESSYRINCSAFCG